MTCYFRWQFEFLGQILINRYVKKDWQEDGRKDGRVRRPQKNLHGDVGRESNFISNPGRTMGGSCDSDLSSGRTRASGWELQESKYFHYSISRDREKKLNSILFGDAVNARRLLNSMPALGSGKFQLVLGSSGFWKKGKGGSRKGVPTCNCKAQGRYNLEYVGRTTLDFSVLHVQSIRKATQVVKVVV